MKEDRQTVGFFMMKVKVFFSIFDYFKLISCKKCSVVFCIWGIFYNSDFVNFILEKKGI